MKPIDKCQRYLKLHEKYLIDELTDKEEAYLLAEMDTLWYAMTSDEIQFCEHLTRCDYAEHAHILKSILKS